MSLDYVKNKWNILGERDPYWSILTWPDKKGNKWEIEEFYKTGDYETNTLLRQIKDLGIKIRFDKVLDFGCGAGRISSALSRYFQFVIGVDISSEMIELANNNIANKNIKFYLNEKEDLRIFNDDTFDFIVSLITLQHIEIKSVKKYIKEFIRVLSPRGIIAFQLPHMPKKSQNNFISKLKYRVRNFLPYKFVAKYNEYVEQNELFIDMHGLSPDIVKKTVTSNGGILLDLIDDNLAGDEWVSYKYIVTKN